MEHCQVTVWKKVKKKIKGRGDVNECMALSALVMLRASALLIIIWMLKVHFYMKKNKIRKKKSTICKYESNAK